LNRIGGRFEGLLLLLIGFFVGWFALFGNYEFLMNLKFRWLTLGGAMLVLCMGFIVLLRPRIRFGFSSVGVFLLLAVVVAVARPHLQDVNSLTLPQVRGVEGVPLVINDTRYANVGIDELNRSIIPGEAEYEDRHVVMTGLFMRTPELDTEGRIAVLRPYSFCCAADALLIGIRAEGRADTSLSDQWVNVYGRIRRLDTPLPPLKIQHGAIRYASVPEDFILEIDHVAPYIPPRPKDGVMEKLASGNYSIFLQLAEAADLALELQKYDLVTVLAPVDQAFEALPEGFAEKLLSRRSQRKLKAFVGRHVLVGALLETDLSTLTSAETITGDRVKLEMVDGKLSAEDSRFLFKNTVAKNGVIHAIYPALQP
jgi:uncharacterized surface protein with fasciclin (FAS1) repeats